MRHLLIILAILLLPYPLLGQSKEDCYLFVVGDIGKDKAVIGQIVRPLLSSFITPLKEDPVMGLSQSDLESSCYYEVLVTLIDETLNLSINGIRTPISFNGLSKSSRSFPENVRHSFLRILHKELDKSKKDEICRKYTEILVDECPQNQNLIIVFNKYSDQNVENIKPSYRSWK